MGNCGPNEIISNREARDIKSFSFRIFQEGVLRRRANIM